MSAQERVRERLNAREEAVRERGVECRILDRGDPRVKEVALTFDDGPHPAWTPQLLDLLASLRVRATFFLVGKMVDKYPELAAREVVEGHEVANHTYDHISLARLDEPQIEHELRRGAAAIERAVGYTPVFFRPPGGRLSVAAREAASRLHMVPVMWTANSKDFTYPLPTVVEDRLLSSQLNGGILLCHDGIPETMQMLPDLVSRLRREGYRFVTVSEMAKDLAGAEARPDKALSRAPSSSQSSRPGANGGAGRREPGSAHVGT